MKLIRETTLDRNETKLTDFCRETKPNERSIMECENVSEFLTAKTTAYGVRNEDRGDGHSYKVTIESATQRVIVSLTK